MTRRGFIRAEDLQDRQVEAFPYFPVDARQARSSYDEGLGSIASDLGDDSASVPVEQRIIERLQEAERQAQEIARQAFEEGFTAGEAEGRAFGESTYRTYIQRLETHLAELAGVSVTLQAALNEELIALALAVGEHLAIQQIQASPEAVLALLERTLEDLPFPLPRGRRDGEMPMQVVLNPADLTQLGELFPAHPGLTLVADPTLSRGSLRIEAPQGILNGTLERRREHMMLLLQRMADEDAP